MPEPAATKPRRRSSTMLSWAAANLALGYLATFPLVAAVVLSYYVRAKLWGTVAAPYHEAEAVASVAVIGLLGAAAAAGTVALNRALRRQGPLQRQPAGRFWAATVIIQLMPFAWFMLATDRTFPVLLGKGLLW